MTIKIFVAGTDTSVGKTTLSVTLLQLFNAAAYQTIGLKPVATGGLWQGARCYNEDALALQQVASIALPYSGVNPFMYPTPAAPFIAAQQMQQSLTAEVIIEQLKTTLAYPADCFIIEGAGGWFTPLNPKETMADIVQALNLPVILVVGMRLGCLNHTLLTLQAIQQSGLKLMGWIANAIDPTFDFLIENINFLKDYLSAPCLGVVNYGAVSTKVINLPLLLSRIHS